MRQKFHRNFEVGCNTEQGDQGNEIIDTKTRTD